MYLIHWGEALGVEKVGIFSRIVCLSTPRRKFTRLLFEFQISIF